MTRALSTIAAGWLLVTYYGGTIAWYETKKDCLTVSEWGYQQSGMVARCIPDRFGIDEIRPKAKP